MLTQKPSESLRQKMPLLEAHLAPEMKQQTRNISVALLGFVVYVKTEYFVK